MGASVGGRDGCLRLEAAMTHRFSIQYCANLQARRTEARISEPSSQSGNGLVALVYDTSQGFVVEYFGPAAKHSALPGLDRAVAEARVELRHYIHRRGENPPPGITRPGLSLWLTERDDETVVETALK